MDVEFVLNELSIGNPFSDVVQAHTAMVQFVELVKTTRSTKLKSNIRTHKELTQIEIAPGYFISNWCVDQNVDRDQRLYILKLLTNFPIYCGLPQQLLLNAKEVEVLFEGVTGEGLTVAHLAENPVLSFNSHAKWQVNNLPVVVRMLRLDPATNDIHFFEANGNIINLCTPENLVANLGKIEALQQKRFDSIEDFWAKRQELFGRLRFAPSFKDNLETIGISSPLFQQIVSVLGNLEEYCTGWNTGPCRVIQELPHISPESQSTLQKFRQDRIFKDEVGTAYLCELHARLTPGPQRLHFFPVEQERIIFVGYVGSKLPE